MRALILSLFACFCVNGYCQKDSALYQLLQINNDTERVNQVYKAGFDLRNTDPQLAYKYALAAEQEAQKTNSKKHLAKSYNLKGILHYKKGDYTTALSYQHKALRLNEADAYAYGVAINQTNLGNIYSDMGYNDLAESSYLQAIKAYNSLNSRLQIENSLMNLGVLKSKFKRYDIARKYFQTALAMASEDNNVALMASCNNNIGSILVEQNQADSALLYLDESWKLLNIQENGMEMADVYINMADAWIRKNNNGKAKHYLTLADSICKVYDYTDAKVHVYDIYASLFEKQGDYRQANEWLKKHYRLKDSILQLSKVESDFALNEEPPVQAEKQEEHEAPAFKNEWILVILGAFLIGIPLFLIRYKR